MSSADWRARAVAAFVERARAAAHTRGVVLVGSVARDTAKDCSDVDVYLVVEDRAFDRAAEENRISYVDRTGIDDPNGYVDVKLVSPAYLSDGVRHGDDPLRASFVGSRVLWDAGDGIAALIDGLLDPGTEYFDRLRTAFVAQVALHGGYFLRQAIATENPLLAHHAAVHAAYAAGRLALATDRVFFRGAKYLDEQLAASPSAPPALAGLLTQLVRHPTVAGLRAVEVALQPLVPEGFAITDDVLSRFITDNELSWRTRTPPPEFR